MANYGIRARDSSGAVIFDLTTKLTRILGVRSTTSSNGSFTHPAFSQGTPFFIMALNNSRPSDRQYPRLYVSGSRIYWEFPSGDRLNPIAVQFTYGVYI